MKIHTEVIYQITDTGLELVSDIVEEYTGKITKCKGGGSGSCPPPDPTPVYEFTPATRANAALGGQANTNMNAGMQNAGIVGLPGAAQPMTQMPPTAGANPLGGPGGQGARPMMPGQQPQVDPRQLMGIGNPLVQQSQQPPQPQIPQYNPNNPYQR